MWISKPCSSKPNFPQLTLCFYVQKGKISHQITQFPCNELPTFFPSVVQDRIFLWVTLAWAQDPRSGRGPKSRSGRDPTLASVNKVIVSLMSYIQLIFCKMFKKRYRKVFYPSSKSPMGQPKVRIIFCWPRAQLKIIRPCWC